MPDKIINTIRKARRVGKTNKIDAIRAIREAFPEAGLKAAKDCWEFIEHLAVPATNIEAFWCFEHWHDRLRCGCPLGTPKAQTASTGGAVMTKPDGTVVTDPSSIAWELEQIAKSQVEQLKKDSAPKQTGEPTILGWSEKQANANPVEFLRVYMAEVRRLNPGVGL